MFVLIADQPVRVVASNKNSLGKRIRDKRHCCHFCQALLVNMARHFELKHSNETEVAAIIALPKSSAIRRQQLSNLLKAGDFYYNIEVLAAKSGELLLARRPTPQEAIGVDYMDYGPCPKCLGFFLKKHLWHHVRYSCGKRNNSIEENISTSSKSTYAESAAIVNGVLGMCQITVNNKSNYG